MTIDEQKRTCSYHIGPTYRTWETFLKHWNKCPVRIKAGYIKIEDTNENVDEDLGGHS